MVHNLMIVPTGIGVGLTSVAQGTLRALEYHGLKVGYFKPVNQVSPKHKLKKEKYSIAVSRVELLLSQGKTDDLLEEIIANYERLAKSFDVILIQGLFATSVHPYAHRLNVLIREALDANIIFVATPGNNTPNQVGKQLEIVARYFGGIDSQAVIGCIINKINAPVDEQGSTRLDLASTLIEKSTPASIKKFETLKNIKLLAVIPWKTDLIAPRVIDIAKHLKTKILNRGEIETRRILHITLCARSIENMLSALTPGTLVITSADRNDIILATSVSALNGVKIAALLLTGEYKLKKEMLNLCQQAIQTGLPILSIKSDSFRTALLLQDLNLQVPKDDIERIEKVKDYSASFINSGWIENWIKTPYTRKLTPAAFRYSLIQKARKKQKRIILPEGTEPRTIEAAISCARKRIAHCILLGDKQEIKRIADLNGIQLHVDVEIINPEDIREKYIEPLVKLRKHKGINQVIAKEQLKDNVTLATMMLAQNEVDGLISGAVHTTANTIRPALQLIKTAKSAKIVSSIFFMCLPNQVLVYGDCAVNPDPSAKELADIAIQSAMSAKKFGITPKIAMISYSTGASGKGVDVEKVRTATNIVKKKKPKLIIDGPLQYDAAINESVAHKKAPQSPVAGHASVVIFPDLNTGNTTYKAVQRSADVLCIGPMLQGLNKPVNDLSRGATIDDIVYTIAITAIQAQ